MCVELGSRRSRLKTYILEDPNGKFNDDLDFSSEIKETFWWVLRVF